MLHDIVSMRWLLHAEVHAGLQGKDIGRLLAMAASLEQAAVKEWLGSLSDPSDALGIDKLPESVLAEVQQHLSSLTLVPSPEIAS